MTRTFEMLQRELKDSLERLKCVQVVESASRHGDIRFLFRVTNEPKWNIAMKLFLEREKGWYSFIGTKYMLVKGVLVYGWVFILEAEDLEKAVMGVRRLLAEICDQIHPADVKEETYLQTTDTILLAPLPWESDKYDKILRERVNKFGGRGD